MDKDAVLSRLPGAECNNIREVVGNTFIEHLKNHRDYVTTPQTTRERKRLSIPPEKSISAEDLSKGISIKEKQC